MEQNIKNFDRGIEQMMNEHEVAPPFGMWNRISADLEAMPIAATAPVVTSLIPKRAMLGIIAAALILGTTVITGYLVKSSLSHNATANSTNTQIAAPVTTTVSGSNTNEQTIAVKNDITPAKQVTRKTRVHHVVALNPVPATLHVAQVVAPTINQPVTTTSEPITINNASTDVPTPIEPVTQSIASETQTYYFPPVDVTTPEHNKAATETASNSKNHGKIANAASSDNDGPSEHKVKFRLHKKHGWAYGNIIK